MSSKAIVYSFQERCIDSAQIVCSFGCWEGLQRIFCNLGGWSWSRFRFHHDSGPFTFITYLHTCVLISWFYFINSCIYDGCCLYQALNLILLTSSELAELRALLKQSLMNTAGRDLFLALYSSWCHSPMATISLCLLAQVAKLCCPVQLRIKLYLLLLPCLLHRHISMPALWFNLWWRKT